VARLELHIETANVGADTGRTDRERFQGEEKRSLSLSTFSPFTPLQYPSWDEGGADWRNEERRVG